MFINYFLAYSAKDNNDVRNRFRAMKETTEEQVTDYTKSIRDYCK